MLKRSFVIALSLTTLISCGGGAGEEPVVEEPIAEAPAQPQVVEIAALIGSTADYVGKEISVTGTVNHVCKHGGKKLFMMGDDPEGRFKVTAGESVGAFELELEGSTITVTGIVEEEIINEATICALEGGSSAEEAEEAAHEEGADETTEEHHAGEGEQAAHLRQMLTESGEDELSFYSLDCSSFEILE